MGRVHVLPYRELLHYVKRGVFIGNNPCYADAVINHQQFDSHNLYVGSPRILEFDREGVFGEVTNFLRRYQAMHGPSPFREGNGCYIDSTLFLPPIIERYGKYDVLVAGFYAAYTFIDAGEAVSGIYVKHVVRSMPAFKSLPVQVPARSVDIPRINFITQNNGYDRYFIFDGKKVGL